MASSIKGHPLPGRNIKQETVVHVICNSPPIELASSMVPPVTGKEVVVVTEDMPSTSTSPSGQETGETKIMFPDSTGTESPKDDRKAGGGKVGSSSKKKSMCEKDSEEYKRRRERNNEAVRKSRQKSRQKASETEMRVTELKKENADLEQRVTLLHKELELLKDLFLTHATDLPDPSTTFGLFSANPNLGSSSPNPALSRVILKTDTVTVSLSCKNVPESITTTT